MISEETLAKKHWVFVNIVPNLHFNTYNVNEFTTSESNFLTSIINKSSRYIRHDPSIKAIKNNFGKKMPKFSFIETNKSIIMKTKPYLQKG